ncbi:hypothetical protein [Virgibacillus senegalensis]|uniref:hypothetical protein n=1 Tax=Virgibacillus senegalensis TaxID=1499679 RepID=UPI00069CC336|nr:hypothetical protein [Virgibacillus senegalensis]
MLIHQKMLQLQLETTLYFENNPNVLETVEGLSRKLERNTPDLAEILNHLVTLKILDVQREGDSVVYFYNQPKLVSEFDLSWEKA